MNTGKAMLVRKSSIGLFARGWRNLLYRMVLIGALILVPMPLTPRAYAAEEPLINAHCFQASSSPFSSAAIVVNGGEMAVANADPVTIRLDYYHGNDSDSAYPVNFTATINDNAITGTGHTFDTQVRWGGAGLATGGGKDLPIDTSAAVTSTRIIINVTSDATGTNILATCDFTLTVLAPNGDADGDGLLNRWETNGIDANNDGTIDLKLSSDPYNAKWNHKDIFVEADYMSGHAPESHVIGNVTTAFAMAPVHNLLDSTDGITLHVLLDEEIPNQESILFKVELLGSIGSLIALGSPPANCPNWSGCLFDDIKLGARDIACDGYFGTQSERSTPDCEVRLEARKKAFRYVLFGNEIADGRVLGGGISHMFGIAELPGNDLFVVACPRFNDTCLNEARQSDTFMHELGHTLGLHHGGADDINCKPNYLSVMNYAQHWQKNNASQFPLDYSQEELQTLNEASLNETAGISGPAGRKVVYGVGGKEHTADTNGPVDWNGDGPYNSGTVAADINWIASACGTPMVAEPGQILRGHDDWHNLQYGIQAGGDFADYTHATAPLDEMTLEIWAKIQDDDLDTIFNADDNCISVPNTNQADRDHDNIGDLCDPDSDPPTVNLVTPPDGAVYILGSNVTANYSCADEVGGSGLASCVGTLADRATIDTSSVGTKSFTVTARDGEGHQTVVTHQYRIAYAFEGFFSPVDNNMLNIAKAGQAIALKWRLTDSAGNPITNLVTASVTVVSLSCSTGQTADEVEEYATGLSGLQNLGNGYYQFNWMTPKTYAKSCKTMRLDLGEGAPRTANFQFR
jgi:hypothetical protein